MIMATRQANKLLKEIKKEYPNAKILKTALGEMVSSQRLPLANAKVEACGNENFRRNLLPQLH